MAGDEVAVRDERQLAREGREGARWINKRPTPAEFGDWAEKNIPIAEGLKIEDYVGGIVLIPAVDSKAKYVFGVGADGQPLIAERPELAYIPYVKVETRLKYFWDLVELKDEKWLGVIEPVTTARPSLEMLSEVVTDIADPDDELPAALQKREVFKAATTAAIVHQLPPGFFLMPVPVGDSYTYSLCCSYRVAIYERGTDAEARPIREGRGTKQVALLVSGWGQNKGERTVVVDENALMKAETGAIGRALGAAGILTIPGSGIATAEDMYDQVAGGNAAPVPPAEGAGPAAPAEPPAPASVGSQPETQAEVLETVKAIVGQLRADFPEAHAAFLDWCNKRRPKITSLDELELAALRGVRTKVEKLLEEARRRKEQAPQDADAAPKEVRAEPEPEPKPKPDAPPAGPSAVDGEPPAALI